MSLSTVRAATLIISNLLIMSRKLLSLDRLREEQNCIVIIPIIKSSLPRLRFIDTIGLGDIA